jgi:Rrf2 family protein
MSTRGRYALRAMFEITICEEKGPVSLNHISKTQNISRSYLGQLFIRLQKAGLIRSIRGPKGGYLLSKNPGNIPIGDIIRAAEGSIAPVRCVEDSAYKYCKRVEKCVCHLYWEKLDKHITDFLNSATLLDLCEEARIWG